MTEITGDWSEVTIAGKIADVYEPATWAKLPASPDHSRRAILHLHGHGLTTLKDNPIFTSELERHELACVCPHGQRSWWLDVVCREFDAELTPMRYLIEHIVPWMTERWSVTPPAIGLTGISMGGQGVLQLAYRRPRDFPVVAAISPAVDFHNWHGQGLPLDEMFPTREAARQQTATLQFHPLNWPKHQLIVCDPADEEWIESSDRLTMKLRSMGIPFEHDFETTAGGHTWDYFNCMAAKVIGFVAERLEAESRRI